MLNKKKSDTRVRNKFLSYLKNNIGLGQRVLSVFSIDRLLSSD